MILLSNFANHESLLSSGLRLMPFCLFHKVTQLPVCLPVTRLFSALLLIPFFALLLHTLLPDLTVVTAFPLKLSVLTIPSSSSLLSLH